MIEMNRNEIEKKEEPKKDLFESNLRIDLQGDNEEKERNNKRNFKKEVILLILALLSGFSGGFAAVLFLDSKQVEEGNAIVAPQPLQREESKASFVYKKAHKSVVEIEITASSPVYSFFGESLTEAAGSGVILTEDGYIVTNYHVIEDAEQITIILHDGQAYQAEVVGEDQVSDLAVLKIETAENLKPAVFANSDDIQVGEAVFPIGNPLGEFGGSITEGIISAEQREIVVGYQVIRVLQTSAAINPGNSGGGLFNSQGEVVGIVNAKSSGESIEGIGFAIPSNFVQEIVNQLMKEGYVSNRATLGIYVSFQMFEEGMIIQGLVEGGAAEKAGIQQGDILLQVDQQDIGSYYDLKRILMSYQVGDVVELTVLRDGEELKFTCTLMEASPTQ